MPNPIKSIRKKMRKRRSKEKKLLVPDYFNHKRTVETIDSIDEEGSPVPWITYPAIFYLKQIDFSDWSVFEYGCGASTRFWSEHARKVVSVEHDEQWAATIDALALPNVHLIHATTGSAYAESCAHGAPHDVIVVDGRWRYDCAMTCLRALSPGGLVILDNAERYPVITQYLRDNDLIQVDFIGTGPINTYVWATSIFFSRTVRLRPAAGIQPHHIAGMVNSVEANPEFNAANLPGSF